MQIIKQLEKEIGIKLKELEKIEWYSPGYKLDENKDIVELFLCFCELEKIPVEIGELKNLQLLDLSSNKLTSLPAEIGELKNLLSLYLSSNKLTSLPKEITKLKIDIKWEGIAGGKGIFLKDNPLKNPPSEIIKQGRKFITPRTSFF
ncbi:hypothetical protein GMMP15_530005 [Candidatus Magnetomoraceae bacterium gMMP-15]